MKANLLVVFGIFILANCEHNPHVRLEENCKESEKSIERRQEFVLRCANPNGATQTNKSDELEQREDIIDECIDHSKQMRSLECGTPTLVVYTEPNWKPCNAILNETSVYGQACQKAAESYRKNGVKFL